MKTDEEKIRNMMNSGIMLFRSKKKTITMYEALTYEIESSWWAGSISWPWLQMIISSYFAWKVRKKYARYQFNLINKELIT